MNFPRHIAIIPDGNRTRAKEQWLDSYQGHLAGEHNSIALAQYIFEETPVETLTFRWLSTENLQQRSEQELEYLSRLYEIALQEVKELLHKCRVSFRRVGNALWLPAHLIDVLTQTQEECTFESTKTLVIGINYGWKDEIIRGIQKLTPEEVSAITAETLTEKLDFYGLPTVDLLIRTKWDVARRLSWFMLWRIDYAELFFSPLKFPAFTPAALQEALVRYDSVAEQRNFGK